MLISTKDLLPHISDVQRVSSQPPEATHMDVSAGC